MDLMTMSPAIVIFLVGFGVSLIMSLVNKKVLSTEKAKGVKKKMQEVREKMLKAQKEGNVKKANSYLSEMMKINAEYMKFTFKPMLVSIVLVILIIPFLRNAYTNMTIVTIPQSFPMAGGWELSWFWWYFLCTFVVGIIFRKILGI